ncbi:unnamed protein product [Callosobruchus maculatus]|uniref:Integrase catalytic domain-containing protein n=1 Tax=Callosobruchus maculatus TaxID=64391 RepID=A0A653DWJ6_CALMS|nr:unnamed protein product [Callosobruchus maculatus]
MKYTEKQISFCNLSTDSMINIQEQLEKFWRIEDCCISNKMYSMEEQEVESHFAKTTKHDDSGQFIVKLPLRENFADLGDSYDMALKRFYCLERKMKRDKELKELYCDFMKEYSALGHMSVVPAAEINTENICYYLPHHGVLKQSSLTTKLRTVFDASAQSSSGLSLNDVLKVGPVIQDDLFSILTRFRKHNYVISADIAKMFRCVAVQENQRDLQRIIWRPDPSQDLQIYRLNTVTYGQACASYLAIRCLYQVGIDNEENFPVTSRAIKRDFYCDDLLTGSDTIDGCVQLRKEISELLEKRNFLLRKWASNEQGILQDSQRDDIFQYIINDDKELRTLGILWDTKLDSFGFSVEFEIPSFERVTKRNILSTISRLFDPLGLAGPVLIQAKLILQDLCRLSLSWDDVVPPEVQTFFVNFCKDLRSLVNIKIPRQAIIKNSADIEIHGFCDSSEKSYGACVMLRSVDSLGNCKVALLCAKARVAPLKTQTLPRLELLGAVTLSRLINKVVNALELSISEQNIFYWTDSTIVLGWLNTEPSTLKCFVANRVAEIQQLTKIEQWRHVRTHHNPADIISRGAAPSALLNCELWWTGPSWLVQSPEDWPKPLELGETKVTDLPERRNVEGKALLLTKFENFDLFTKYSSLPKLQRICAYLLRFINNTVHKVQGNKMNLGPLSVKEYKTALLKLTFIAQRQMFPRDIQRLQTEGKLDNDSKILSLNPYLDEFGLLRIGGRIKHSDLSSEHKHPLLINDKHPFSLLIIQYEHFRHFHAGNQATLTAVRQTFWLINGRNAIRKYIRGCVTCFRANPMPNVVTQMADLPERRVKPARPFLKSGVDLAGPFFIKNSQKRNRQMIKSYLCVFVCLVTRAVHFEICTDLSSETFIAALKRFIARRGICASLLSDNGSNFIGARRELRETYQFLQKIHKDPQTSHFLQENYISWELIPPRAPHFGGIWESAVKSAKHHIKRIAANAHLTFELFYTLIVEIEAILNSRPLTPLSSDANDFQVLTPGHFLIGDSMKSTPDHDYIETPLNRLTHYQRIQKMFQQFWVRWKNEYLTNLQQRSKWKSGNDKSVKPGTMVIVKEDNTLPMQWPIGRITKVFPGKDGVIRVVDVRTKGGTFRRPTSKICVLPLPDQIIFEESLCHGVERWSFQEGRNMVAHATGCHLPRTPLQTSLYGVESRARP